MALVFRELPRWELEAQRPEFPNRLLKKRLALESHSCEEDAWLPQSQRHWVSMKTFRLASFNSFKGIATNVPLRTISLGRAIPREERLEEIEPIAIGPAEGKSTGMRKEKSLGHLCGKFLRKCVKNSLKEINLDEMTTEMSK
jgi:hypothetical protein